MQRDGRLKKLRMLREALADPAGRAPVRKVRGLPDSRFWRAVLFNLVVGGATLAALRLAPDWPWLATREEQALDWMVRMQAGVAPEGDATPFVLLELDEDTYRAWGEPLFVPREPLRELIEFAVRGGAALVLVDVDLSRPSDGDAGLVAYLSSFVREGPRSDGPQILLARTFREPHPPGRSPWREQRPSFLDEVVAGAPDLHWASTLFLQDPDLRIRRFRNAEPTCNDGAGDVVPAIQLLGLALLEDRAAGPERLAAALAPERPACGGAAATAPAGPVELRLGDVDVTVAADRVSTRILYAFGWSQGGDAPNPTVRFEGRDVPLLTRLPARLVTEAAAPPDPSLVAGRIVTIGASFAESRDLHRTPLGVLPGAVILQNALHSLLQNGGLKPPPAALVAAVQLGLLGLAAFGFAALSSFWATLLAAPLTIAALLPLSFWLFRAGVWLDLAIPIGAIQILAFARRYAERYAQFRAQLERVRGLAADLEKEEAES